VASDYPTDTSLIWTEFARQYYLNPNAYSAGQSYSIFGKLRAPILAETTDLLPFSRQATAKRTPENHAIILLAYSEALLSDKKQNIAGGKDQEARAMGMLDMVWKPMGERKADKMPQNTPFFNTQDMFNTRRSSRYDTPTGNF